jgi:hypothetical protein
LERFVWNQCKRELPEKQQEISRIYCPPEKEEAYCQVLLKFSATIFSIQANRAKEGRGAAGRVPYYFSRASVVDMIPIKEAHAHPLVGFPGATGGRE